LEDIKNEIIHEIQNKTVDLHTVYNNLDSYVDIDECIDALSHNYTDYLGRTIIHILVNINNSKLLKNLIDNNSLNLDLNIQDTHGCTALHYAYLMGVDDCINILENNSLVDTKITDNNNLTAKDYNNKENIDKFTNIIVRSPIIDKYITDTKTGDRFDFFILDSQETFITLIAQNLELEKEWTQLNHIFQHFKFDVSQQNKYGSTILHILASHSNKFKILFDNNVIRPSYSVYNNEKNELYKIKSVNTFNNHEEISFENRNLQLIKFPISRLIELIFDNQDISLNKLNTKDKNGNSALDIAIKTQNIIFIETLIKKKLLKLDDQFIKKLYNLELHNLIADLFNKNLITLDEIKDKTIYMDIYLSLISLNNIDIFVKIFNSKDKLSYFDNNLKMSLINQMINVIPKYISEKFVEDMDLDYNDEQKAKIKEIISNNEIKEEERKKNDFNSVFLIIIIAVIIYYFS